jgi:hypothetical protein
MYPKKDLLSVQPPREALVCHKLPQVPLNRPIKYVLWSPTLNLCSADPVENTLNYTKMAILHIVVCAVVERYTEKSTLFSMSVSLAGNTRCTTMCFLVGCCNISTENMDISK